MLRAKIRSALRSRSPCSMRLSTASGSRILFRFQTGSPDNLQILGGRKYKSVTSHVVSSHPLEGCFYSCAKPAVIPQPPDSGTRGKQCLNLLFANQKPSASRLSIPSAPPVMDISAPCVGLGRRAGHFCTSDATLEKPSTSQQHGGTASNDDIYSPTTSRLPFPRTSMCTAHLYNALHAGALITLAGSTSLYSPCVATHFQ
jgi:hypothetical protein